MGAGRGKMRRVQNSGRTASWQIRGQKVPEGHGADDYESGAGEALQLIALQGTEEVGCLKYNLCPDHIRIRWIEIEEGMRRHGVARSLLQELSTRHGLLPLTTGGVTPEGDALFAAPNMPPVIEEVDTDFQSE